MVRSGGGDIEFFLIYVYKDARPPTSAMRK